MIIIELFVLSAGNLGWRTASTSHPVRVDWREGHSCGCVVVYGGRGTVVGVVVVDWREGHSCGGCGGRLEGGAQLWVCGGRLEGGAQLWGLWW